MTEPINQLTLKDAAGLERFIGELSKAIVHGYNCPVTDDFSLRVQGQEAKVSSTIRAIYDDCFPIIRSELAKGGEVEKAVQKICELQDDYEAGEMTQDQFKDWVRSTLASALRPDTKYARLVEAGAIAVRVLNFHAGEIGKGVTLGLSAGQAMQDASDWLGSALAEVKGVHEKDGK